MPEGKPNIFFLCVTAVGRSYRGGLVVAFGSLCVVWVVRVVCLLSVWA